MNITEIIENHIVSANDRNGPAYELGFIGVSAI
jgi:hypothetical protein